MAKSPLIKVRAIKRGTVAVKSGTYHFDPKSKHARARQRSVPVDAAEAASKKGLIKILGEGSERTAGSVVGRALGIDVSLFGAEQRERSADAEHGSMTEVFGAGGADTRDTTAFQRKPVGLSEDQAAGSETPRQIRLGDETARAETLLEDQDPDDDEDGDLDVDEDEDDEDAREEHAIDEFLREPGDDQLRQEGDAGGGDRPPVEPAGAGDIGGDGGGDAAGQSGDQAPPPPAQPPASKPAPAKARTSGAAKPGPKPKS